MPRARSPRLDRIDRKLLGLLQQNADRPLHDLGADVGLSASAVQRRLTRYRESGLIERQVAILDPDAVPGTVLACVMVTLERESTRHHASFRQRMRAAPEVQQCYDLAGEWDYLVIVVARGMRRCRQLLDELFMQAPNIKRFDTRFVFDIIKAGLAVPIETEAEDS